MHITSIHGVGMRERIARFASWVLYIETNDPVRRIQNRMLAAVLVIMLPFGLLQAFALATWLERFAIMAGSLAILVAFYYNRRGTTVGTILFTVIAVLAVGVLAHPDSFTAPPELPVIIDSALIIPVAIAAMFLGPRAAALSCIGTICVLLLGAWLRGTPASHIINFLVFGVATIVVLSALLAAGAATYMAALRRVYVLNDELEARVGERTAELNRVVEQLQAIRSEIEQRAETRARETTEVVHDMRNHMTTLAAAVELLVLDSEDAGLDPAAVVRMRTTFEHAFDAQRELLDALHEAALLQSNALVLQRTMVDLAYLVRHVVMRVQPRYDREQCALELDLAQDLPIIQCDERRMIRVLQNLLDNALTYTAAYRSDGRRVCVRVWCSDQQAIVQVIDNGPGIAAEQIATLGERYRRIVTGVGTPEGSGIGLNASIGIVALHGGSLQIMSAGLGQGATVEVRLPLPAALAAPVAEIR